MFIIPSARAFAVAASVVLASAPLIACEEEGPAEELGEAIDNSVEEAGDAVEDATDG